MPLTNLINCKKQTWQSMTRAELCGLVFCGSRGSLAPLPFITHHSSMIRCEGWCRFTHLRSSPPPKRLSLCPRACLHQNKVASELIGPSLQWNHSLGLPSDLSEHYKQPPADKAPSLPAWTLTDVTHTTTQTGPDGNECNCLKNAFLIHCLGVNDIMLLSFFKKIIKI